MKQKLLLLFASVPSCMGAWAAPAYVKGTSGPMWEYNYSTKTLTISGTGDLILPGSTYYDAPWYNVRSDIENVEVGNDITSIGSQSLSYLTNATSITLGSGITSIADEGLYWNSATNINLPEGLLTIGNNAFGGCRKLESINIPSTVTDIHSGAFIYTPCAINVAVGNANYCSEDGVLFNKTKTILYHYPSYTTATSYTIPETITTINNYAFWNSKLTSIVIPRNVTLIDDSAFMDAALETVEIEGATTPLTIGSWAFDNCDNLAMVTCYRTTLSSRIPTNAFDDCDKLDKIYVPLALVETYENDYVWSPFSVSFEGISINENVSVHEGAVGEYWVTYYNSNIDLLAPDGTTVYAATKSGTKLTLVEIGDRIIKAGEGVILKRTSSEDITLTASPSVATGNYTDNALEGVDAATAQSSDYTYYTLAAEGGTLGFYKYKSANSLGAHKAFVKIENSPSAPAFFSFGEQGGSTTAIGGIQNEGNTSAVVFDLQGRRVQQPEKGIYIINGKKVIVK